MKKLYGALIISLLGTGLAYGMEKLGREGRGILKREGDLPGPKKTVSFAEEVVVHEIPAREIEEEAEIEEGAGALEEAAVAAQGEFDWDSFIAFLEAQPEGSKTFDLLDQYLEENDLAESTVIDGIKKQLNAGKPDVSDTVASYLFDIIMEKFDIYDADRYIGVLQQ